jgi:hypothetical protein
MPAAQYTMRCRQQACDGSHAGESLEQSTPLVKDPARLPDPSTLRRWFAQLVNLGNVLGCVLRRNFPALPTNLAWDWTAIGRILHYEVRGP